MRWMLTLAGLLMGFPALAPAQDTSTETPESAVDTVQSDPRAEVREAVAALEQALSGIESYTCILESYVKARDGKEEHKEYEYAFVRPGYVKMKVIRGGKGEVFYDPTTGKARGRKPGMLSVIRLTLDVNDKRITSIRGHRVDETSWFYLLESWKTYVEQADSVALRKEGNTLVLEAYGIPENPYDEVAMRLYLDAQTHLPLKFEALDANGEVVHRVAYRDVKLNPGLKPDDLRF